MKLKIISTFILFILFFQTICNATNIYVWSDNKAGTTEVNAESADNFLNIESESAILIEQTTRSNTI